MPKNYYFKKIIMIIKKYYKIRKIRLKSNTKNTKLILNIFLNMLEK